ncbi:MAG: efflux RND transporter periplasmic adaptor subunit [Planctomycetota bacterium]
MNRLIVGCAISLLVSCGKTTDDPGPKAATRYTVETAIARSEAPQRSLTAPASVSARETARIAARVSGVLDRVLVNEGDLVRRGQSVADIDAERYRLTAAGAAADLQRARAVRDDAAAAQARRERAAREQPGLISEEELVQVRARTTQAEAEVAAAESRLARAQLDLNDAKVPSPIEGVIQARNAVAGDAVQPGTPIATVVDRSVVLLRFPVPVSDAIAIKPGMEVTFTIAGDPTVRRSNVILVGEVADSRTRQVDIVARVRETDTAAVRPGSFAEARIDLPAGQPRVLVPDLAVQPSEKGYLVWSVSGSGTTTQAIQRRVTVGSRTRDGRIELLTGLVAGDVVVVRGGEALREGALLDVQRTVVEQAKQ